MESHSIRRNYLKIKNGIRRVSKQAFLSLVFLLVVFGNIAPIFARYESYKNLFVGLVGPSPQLEKYTFFKNGTADYDIKFRLQMAFDISSTEEALPQKEKAWDHIVDIDDSEYKFIFRVCDVADVSENNCYFAKIPYEYSQNDDPQPLAGVGEAKTKIHQIHTVPGATSMSLSRDIVHDKFDVIFSLNKFYKLSTEGQLINPILGEGLFYIGNPNSYRADAWYCAEEYAGEELPQSDDSADSTHRQFNNLCGDNRPYFKIASSQVFSVPQSIQEATEEIPGKMENTSTLSTVGGGVVPDCGIKMAGFGSGSITGCIAQAIYYLIYRPVAWFASLMGNLFDFFLGYSLNDESYRANFAVDGWKLVRDISNIFFIVILVWTGLSAVFNTNTNMKKVVPNLILNALLINFSLFATRVVIDISNITARIFYNSIHVCEGACEGADVDSDGIPGKTIRAPGGFTSVSSKIVAQFNPQRIFNSSVLDQTTAIADNGVNKQEGKKLSTSDSEYAGYFIVVSLIAAFIVFAIAMMFWKTAFFFLGRVIGLYMAMIFAPLAFLTRGNIPVLGGIKSLSWDGWLKDLTNYALLAPIFVFFLYIISTTLNSDFIKVSNMDISTSFFETVMYITIPMLIIYFLIKQGVDIAKKFGGKIGEAVQSGAQKVVGFAGGVAMGGTALMGGRVLGGAANVINKSAIGSRIRDAAPDSWLARKTLRGLKSASAGSYDVRQTTIGKGLFKEMGINTNQKGLDTLKGAGLGLSAEQRKGGFESDVKRRKKDKKRTAELFEEKMSDDDINKYNARLKKKRQEKIDPYVEGMMQVQFGKSVVEEWKKSDKQKFEQEKAALLKNKNVQDKINQDIPPVKELKSIKEITKDRKERYVKNLEKEGFLGKIPFVREVSGAGVRETGDKEAAKNIQKEVKAETKRKKIEELSKNVGEKLEETEKEFEKISNKLQTILENEAKKHTEYAGRDISKLSKEEQLDLLQRREDFNSGDVAMAETKLQMAIDKFKKNSSPLNKTAVMEAKRELVRAENKAQEGVRAFNKKEKIEKDLERIKSQKIQADDRLENMDYRKKQEAEKEKKDGNSSKKGDESKK